MDFQHSHRYMRPPLPPRPSMADPNQQPQLRQPVVSPGSWYSGQFQYRPPSQHSSSPPPPNQQWAPPPPPPHSDHLPPPPYSAPPPYPLTAQPLHNQYPPPSPAHSQRPLVPPPYHPHSQIPQSYPQDWGNANWGHPQGWEYPAHHNEEDWAAKARAWATAKAATDNQHSQSLFTPVSRLEEQGQYHDQYPQTVDPHYPDVLQPPLPALGHQQYPAPVAPPHRPPVVHPQESASISSGQSSFVPDEHWAYGARDGNLAGDSNAVFPHQERSPTTSSVHLQEVPSSYSSVSGKEGTGDQNDKFYKSFSLPIDSNQGLHMHLPLPAVGRSVSLEHPHYAVGNQAAEAPIDLSDQPLNFTHRFNHDHDPLMQPNYTHTDSGGPIRGGDHVAAAVPFNHTWTPHTVPGAVYPPIPPVLPSGQQHDPSISVPSLVPGHSAPLFGRLHGPNFQPTIPSIGTPFGIGAVSGLNPTTAFPGDVYSVSDRPKKASVPNWLREEIIKKKAVITNSAPERPKEETEFVEDEAVDKSFGKADQADSKSIESSKSTEDEDDDEDYVEATRTAAVNQEIKRILTEVLLKVTDELFNEIATKVLSEDGLTVEVDRSVVASNHKLSPSATAVPTPKASAKVIIPANANGTETEDHSEKSTSSSPGDVLGLGSYASDDDEDDDNNNVSQQPNTRKLSEDNNTVENGSSPAETEGHSKGLRTVEGDTGRMVLNGATIHHGSVANELSDHRTGRGSSDGYVRSRYSSEMVSGVVEDKDNFDGEKILKSADAFKPNHSVGEQVLKIEPLENISAKKSVTDDSQGRGTRNKHDKNERRETKSSSGKDRTGEREDESHRRQGERHVKKERTDDRYGSKEKMKEQDGKSGKKTKESDSRKRSIHPDVEDRKEKERDRRANAKEDGERRRERAKDEKGERSRHKLVSDSSGSKRRHSSSVGSRGRSSKDNSVVSYANDSSDESSDDSKRKLQLQSKRRNLSPSPNRSSRRHDSRSPHSKHSQRRHLPPFSHDTTRGRRLRSRSPVCRRS